MERNEDNDSLEKEYTENMPRYKRHPSWKIGRVVEITLFAILLSTIAGAIPVFPLSPNPVQAAGNTYYLSPTGNDGGSGSIGSPWLTLDRADNTLQNGDTLLLRGGTYTKFDDFFHPTNGNLIIKNYPGETPIFQAVGRDYYGIIVFMLLDQPNITLDGFSVLPDGAHEGGQAIQLFGASPVMKNLTVIAPKLGNGHYAFSQILWLEGGASNAEIANCHLSGGGDASDPHGNSGQVINAFTNNLFIHDNWLERGVHEVISLWGDGSIIRDNTITHSIGYGVTANPGASRNLIERNSFTGADEEITYVKNPIFIKGDHNIIRNNVAWNNEIYGSATNGVYNRFYNNVFYGNGSDGFLFAPESAGTCTNNTLVNNVIAKNMQTQITCSSYYAEVAQFNESDLVADNNVLTRNYIVAYNGGAWKNDYACSVYPDSLNTTKSVSYMQANYPALWSNNIYNYCDPQFTDTNNGNFHLGSGSCLINAGMALTTATSTTSGTSLVVNDSLYFWPGDQLMIGPSKLQRSVTAVNTGTNALTLDSSATWTSGDAVTLAFTGAAPDIGAFEYSTACVENWSCGAWGTCTNNSQSRTCTDANNCGTITDRPPLTQSCTPPCVENWLCGAWTTCVAGNQSRTCTDSNSCGTTNSLPPLSQGCDSTPPAAVMDLQAF